MATEVVDGALGEARQTAISLWNTFVRNLPRCIVAGLVLLLAGLLAGALQPLLRQRRLESSIPRGRQVFVSLADSWTDLSVRYLVNARERRIWKSRLARAAMEAFNDPSHGGRIIAAYPRRQVMVIGPDGRPREAPELS